jgi:uncharacterized membrane protein (DUF106 family)
MKVIDEFTTSSINNTSFNNTSCSIYEIKDNNTSCSIYEIKDNNTHYFPHFVFVCVISIFGIIVASSLPWISMTLFMIVILIIYGVITRYIHSLNIDYKSLLNKRKGNCEGKPDLYLACQRYKRARNWHFSSWKPKTLRTGKISTDNVKNLINKKTPGIIKFTRGLKDIELKVYNDDDEKYKKKDYKKGGNIFILTMNGIFIIIFFFTSNYYINDIVFPYYKKNKKSDEVLKARILFVIVSVLFLFFNTFIPAKIIHDYREQKKNLRDEIQSIKSRHNELRNNNNTVTINNIDDKLADYELNYQMFKIVKIAIVQIICGIIPLVFMLIIEINLHNKKSKDAAEAEL